MICPACNDVRGFDIQGHYVPCGRCTTPTGMVRRAYQRPGPCRRHKRLTSKSTSTVNTDDSVTVLEVCRCGAHRSVIVNGGKATRGEWK